MQDFSVRVAHQADLPAVQRIYNLGILERKATFETEPKSLDDLRPLLNTNIPFLVAIANAEVCGFIVGLSYSDRCAYAGIVDVSIYIDSKSRGKGIGKSLLTSFLDETKQSGFHKIVAKLLAENKHSQGLFSGCGFRVVGIHENHGTLDGVWHDVMVMEKLL